jgi:hypothetical protein
MIRESARLARRRKRGYLQPERDRTVIRETDLHVRPELVAELGLAIDNGRRLEAALARLGRELVLRRRGGGS